MLVEVKNDGRDVALVVAVASSRASRTKTKARTSPRSYLGEKVLGPSWAVLGLVQLDQKLGCLVGCSAR
jgi:hypothetical protein